MVVSLNELWEMVMDMEAWHAVIHGVAKSRTRLKRLSSASGGQSIGVSASASVLPMNTQD